MLIKQYVKSRKVCKVTFEVPKNELPEGAKVESIAVAGDFNDWDSSATPMTYSKNKKAYRATIDLAPDSEYEFRYLLNGEEWFNDWHADDYVPGSLFEDNCIVRTLAGA